MIQQGNVVRFTSGKSLVKLNPVNYLAVVTMEGIQLEELNNTDYYPLTGESAEIEKFVVKHINETTENVNFLFSGISGMGKTRTVKNISHKLNWPVVFITKDYSIDILLNFTNAIQQPVVFIFDEFEKVYGSESEKILSFFDGINTQNRVVCLASVNSIDGLNRYLINRPGRFLFNFKYVPLKTEQGVEFIKNKIPDVDTKRLYDYLDKIKDLSYDICNSFVRLLELHGIESIEVIGKYFNVSNATITYKIELFCEDQSVNVTYVDDLEHRESYRMGQLWLDVEDTLPLFKDLKIGEDRAKIILKKENKNIHSSFDKTKQYSFIVTKQKAESFSYNYLAF